MNEYDPDLEQFQQRISDGDNLWPSEQEWLIAEVQRLRRLYNEACEMGSGHRRVTELEGEVARWRAAAELAASHISDRAHAPRCRGPGDVCNCGRSAALTAIEAARRGPSHD